MTCAQHPSGLSIIGHRVITRDGHDLGTVKYLRNPRFQVDAPLEGDYWLSIECIDTIHAGRITLRVDAMQLEAYTVDGPAQVTAVREPEAVHATPMHSGADRRGR